MFKPPFEEELEIIDLSSSINGIDIRPFSKRVIEYLKYLDENLKWCY